MKLAKKSLHLSAALTLCVLLALPAAAQETEPVIGVNGAYGVMVVTAVDIYWQTWTFSPPHTFAVKGWNGIGTYGGATAFFGSFSAVDAKIGANTEDVVLVLSGLTQSTSKSIAGAGSMEKQYTGSEPFVFLGFKSGGAG